MDRFSFDREVVVVTGAGRGIGREYALALARRGAHVVVNDLGGTISGESGQSEAPADRVVAEIIDQGGTAVASYESVATEQGARRIIETALQSFGRLHAVINNAGTIRMRPFLHATAEGMHSHLEVNALGTMLVSHAAWPHFVGQGYGRIVNTISGGIFGLEELCDYNAGKGAVFAFTRSLAIEGARHGIRVNAIAPAAGTRMLDETAMPDDVKAWVKATKPATAVSPAAVYLAHRTCALNGETLSVSGGMVARIALTQNRGIYDRELSPEVIADRLAEITDAGTAEHWSDGLALEQARARLFT